MNKIQKLCILIVCVFSFVYPYVWNILYWDQFEMVYSERLHIKAMQEILYVMWSGFTMFGWLPAFLIALITCDAIFSGKKFKF